MTDGFEVDREFLFLGRTFEEYLDLFELEREDLQNGPILDCPGGPSSFHAEAARELARMTDGELRVYPLASLDMARSPYVDVVADALRDDGHAVEFTPVEYDFRQTDSEMLIVS